MTPEEVELFNENKNIVKHIVKKYMGYPNEDLMQYGYMELMKAIKRYDKSRNVKPSTYFYSVLNLAIRKHFIAENNNFMQLDEETNKKGIDLIFVGSQCCYENSNWEDFVGMEDYEYFGEDNKIDTHNKVALIIENSNLSPRQKNVVMDLLKGLTLKQISIKENIAYNYCRKIYSEALVKMKKGVNK